MLPSPYGCRLGPRGYSLSRPQRVHFCYGPVTRGLPWGDLVDRLQSFSFLHLCYPNYGALTFTPAGLSPAEHASLTCTHVGSRTGAPVGRNISTVPRLQPPPRRTQRADFPHCAPPSASCQGLLDLSCRGDFRPVAAHSIAVE